MIRVCAQFPRSLGWRLLYYTRRRSSESISDVTIEGGVAVPVYRARENESVDVLRARLQYQSRKRGMLENGLVLSTFASQHLHKMSHAHLLQYDTLINTPSNDWVIYYWITGKEAIPEEYDNDVMKMLQEHVKNDKREQRYQQPDLKQPIRTEQ